ncbi:MAG: hypothetical protein QG639_435, partial [Patescibacteria group bacterium]|nr:hypothetical protein [Patescibacteria group bacterium]
MSKSATQILLKYVRKPWFTFGLASIGILCCLSGLLLLAAHFSKQAILHVQRGEYSTAIAYTEKSRPIVTTFNTLTFSAIPDLIVWQAALELPVQTAELTDSAVLVMQSSLSGTDSASVESVLPSLAKIKNSLLLIQKNLPNTFLIQDEVPPDYQKLLQESSKSIGDIETILTSLSQGKQTWVVLLQNSEEIRATGGFPGSYVLLNFDTGMLREIIVEDIYDADGQFLGYVAAPPGIREYTSGDKGLRLPDANWWPDFPESAQTMMQFFALGDKNNIAGLVAINLDAAKAVLEVTGPLLLPDYDVEVTKDNIGEVLRTERSEFFPGSIQKKHLLQLTLTQLKQKMSELDSSQKQALASALKNQLEQKEVQLFSTNPEIQDIFSELAVAGELAVKAATNEQLIQDCLCTPIELAIVESNVGINKVNRYVTRKHQLNFTDQQLTIETTFSNNAAPPSATELSALVA